MTYKSIFKGRLEFGNPKSYEKALKMYQHRVENYYKDDVLFIEEDIFDEETYALTIPRFITHGTNKSWKNSFDLLEYVAQFAVAGELNAWMTNEGKILNSGQVEPKSDRVSVQAFLKGRALMDEKGKETEAMAALDKAIAKYEKHSHAYERRGHIHYILKNYKEAHADYTKSIDFCSINFEAYLGRGKLYMKENKYEEAIQDFEMAIKSTIPLEPVYWIARRLKAECHLKKDDYKGALNDLKFYSNRKFKIGDPNELWKRWATFNYGKALIEAGNFSEALRAFDSAIKIDEGNDNIGEADKLFYRGLALKKSGKNGYRKDLRQAAKMGSKKASTLLEAE